MRGARSAPSRAISAGLLIVVLLSTAACGSASSDRGASSGSGAGGRGGTGSTSTPPPIAGTAQFTPTEAAAAPAPDAEDAAAIRLLASDPPPTEAERVGMHDGMQHHRMRPKPTPSDPVVAARLKSELRAARSVAAALPTVALAERAGFRLTSRSIAGIGAHYVDWSRVTRPFDAAAPAMLLFDGDGPDAPLVGLSYLVRSTSEPGGFRAGGAVWHRHAGLCVVHGLLVGENVSDPASCAAGTGDLLAGRDLWMLHVWVVPGWSNRLGTFAAVNPRLCSAARPC